MINGIESGHRIIVKKVFDQNINQIQNENSILIFKLIIGIIR